MSDGDNKIGRLGRLLEYVRTSPVSGADRPRPASSSGVAPEQTRPNALRHDVAGLRQRLAEKLRDVDADKPADLDRARNVIVREILLWEFGDAFINHAEFKAMLGKIDATIKAQPELKDHVRQITLEIQHG